MATSETRQENLESLASDTKAGPVKGRIEQCALQLFATKGYRNTSVREIVEAAGVSKPTLYYYFHNKEHVYETLVTGNIDTFMSELAAGLGKPAPLRERLRTIAGLYFKGLRSEPLLAAAAYRAIFGAAPEDRILDCAAHAARELEMVMGVLRAGAEAGEIPPEAVSEFHALQFLGQIYAYVTRQAAGIQDDLSPGLEEKIVDFFLRGLR